LASGLGKCGRLRVCDRAFWRWSGTGDDFARNARFVRAAAGPSASSCPFPAQARAFTSTNYRASRRGWLACPPRGGMQCSCTAKTGQGSGPFARALSSTCTKLASSDAYA